MLRNKNAFTLGEVLIVLALFGALAAMILPNIAAIKPSKSKVLFKKAYYTAERMVYELVNDEDLYPSEGDHTGLANTDEVTYMGNNYSGANKFCGLLGAKLNTTNSQDTEHTHLNCTEGAYNQHSETCTEAQYTAGTCGSFTTTDGIVWYIPITTPADNSEITIYVDTNGKKDPNCVSGAEGCSRPDRFAILVRTDGKMHVEGTLEKEYLQSNASSRE